MYLLEHRLYTTLLSFFFSRISTNREYQACDKFLIPYPNNFFQVTRAFVHLPIPHDLCDSFFSRHLPEKTLSGYCRSDFSRELDLDNLENIFLSCHHCDLVPIPGAEAILFQVLEEVLQNVGTGQDFLHFQRIVSDFRLQLDGLIAFSDNLPDHILFYLIDCILMDFSINRASDLLNLKLILFLKEKVVSRPQRWKFFDIKIILILLYEVDLTEAPDDFFDALCEIVMTLYVAELEIKDVKQLISVLPLKKRLGFIFSELDKQRPCWGEHCPKLAATLLENVLKVIEEDLHPFDDILPGMLTMFSFTGTAIKSYRAFKAFPEYLNFCSIHPRYTFGPNQCLKCLALANREQRLLIFEALVYHIKVHKTYQNTKLAERYLQEVIDGTELSVEEEMFICEKRKELKI
ncbi:MAG: hypothetical protein MRY21_01780 [Simkaniaceae bacterium]|nr:hypothetical protein [Simkaniaceae bacterium]